MALLTGTHAFLEMLRAEGVKYIFGNPGTSEAAIMDALTNYPDIEYILVVQEGIAIGMADVYARASGEFGVCLSTTGPTSTTCRVSAASSKSTTSSRSSTSKRRSACPNTLVRIENFCPSESLGTRSAKSSASSCSFSRPSR